MVALYLVGDVLWLCLANQPRSTRGAIKQFRQVLLLAGSILFVNMVGNLERFASQHHRLLCLQTQAPHAHQPSSMVSFTNGVSFAQIARRAHGWNGLHRAGHSTTVATLRHVAPLITNEAKRVS